MERKDIQARAWPRTVQAEWRELETETDPELRDAGLLGFAQRQEQAGAPALAAELYAALADPVRGSPLRFPAQKHLDATLGRGDFGPRAEFLLRQLTREATDPTTILALGVGSAVFSLTRLTTLGRLLAAPAAGWSRGAGARALASAAGFALEAPVFTLAARFGGEALGRDQDWSGRALSRDFASSYLVLGGLKLAGWGSGAAYRQVGAGPRARPAVVALDGPGGLPVQTLFQQSGVLSGILLGHALEQATGLRPKLDGATTLTDSLALLFQFHVAGGLSRGLFGADLNRWNHQLDAMAGTWVATSPPLAVQAAVLGAAPGPVPEFPPARSLQVWMSAEGGGGAGSPRRPTAGWMDKLLQAKPPTDATESLNPVGGPYRVLPKPYQNLAEARARSAILREAALDPRNPLEFRMARLAELPEYLAELREDSSFSKSLHSLEKIILRPKISYPVVPGWPEILLERRIPLPAPVAEFYRQDHLLRLRAADVYLQLLLEPHPHVNGGALRRPATFLAEAVLDPHLNRKFRTYFREDVWSRSYFQAEAELRKGLLKRYIQVAQGLPRGSEEAKQGIRMLLAPELLRLSRGEGPVPDYLNDPDLILDMMLAYGSLLHLLPSSLPEVQRADRVLSPLLLSFGERAMAGEPRAIEILGLFARSDPSARAVLAELAKQGNLMAGKLLAPHDSGG